MLWTKASIAEKDFLPLVRYSVQLLFKKGFTISCGDVSKVVRLFTFTSRLEHSRRRTARKSSRTYQTHPFSVMVVDEEHKTGSNKISFTIVVRMTITVIVLI